MKVNLQNKARSLRENNYEISDDIIYRWSPRQMTGEVVTLEELKALVAAGSWAPSSRNNQPWHYYLATNTDEAFSDLLGSLNEGNRIWCKQAGALLVLVSHTKAEYKNKDIPTHSFDTGASWMAFAIEGVRRNLVVHAMAGFNKEIVRDFLEFDSNSVIECMIAVGKPSEDISKDKVSVRRPLTESMTLLK